MLEILVSLGDRCCVRITVAVKVFKLRDHFLSILGLNHLATNDEIKSAFRELSKKYHPDVNKSPDAKDQFIRIKEAYEFLTKGGSEEAHQNVYQEEGLTEKELWREEYRRRARVKEQERQRLQIELIEKLLFFCRPIVLTIVFLNSLFALDYCLPLRNHEQMIEGMGIGYESTGQYGSGKGIYRYDIICFTDFAMRFDKGEVIGIKQYERAVVQTTMIFSKPRYALITIDGEVKRHRQIYNIYHVFGYIIPVMVALGVLFFRLKKRMQKLNVAIMLFVFASMQFILYLIE